jgi:hypothetical protein
MADLTDILRAYRVSPLTKVTIKGVCLDLKFELNRAPATNLIFPTKLTHGFIFWSSLIKLQFALLTPKHHQPQFQDSELCFQALCARAAAEQPECSLYVDKL